MENSLPPTRSGNVRVQSDSSKLLVCYVCLAPPTNPVATFCGHLFCWSCLNHWQQNKPKPCPVCRLTLVRRNKTMIFIQGGNEIGSAGGAAGPTDGNVPEASTSSSIPLGPTPLPSSASGSSGSEIKEDLPNVLKCHICRTLPTDPVATACGHIFCWPCLYRQQQQHRRSPKPCEVCSAPVRVEIDVVPLYGSSPVQEDSPGQGAIPPRPKPRISTLESSGFVWTAPGLVLPRRPDDVVLPLGLQMMSLLSEIRDCVRETELFLEEMREFREELKDNDPETVWKIHNRS